MTILKGETAFRAYLLHGRGCFLFSEVLPFFFLNSDKSHKILATQLLLNCHRQYGSLLAQNPCLIVISGIILCATYVSVILMISLIPILRNIKLNNDKHQSCSKKAFYCNQDMLSNYPPGLYLSCRLCCLYLS